MSLIETQCCCGAPIGDHEVVSTRDSIRAVQCTHCDQIRTLHRPADYESLYTDGPTYHDHVQRDVGHQPYKDRADHDYKLGTLRVWKLMTQHRALDVGCANGGFLKSLTTLGWRAEGIELNPGMATFAEYFSGCRVHTSWDTVKAPFDLITYHDVFEHVVDPHAELMRVRRYLSASGLLVLDMPDAAEVFGPNARARHHERPEQHMWYFSEMTLRDLLSATDFAVMAVDRPIVGKLVVYARQWT